MKNKKKKSKTEFRFKPFVIYCEDDSTPEEKEMRLSRAYEVLFTEILKREKEGG